MTKLEIATDTAPRPAGAYSQGIRIGDVIYTAGQGGIDPSTGEPVEGIEAQTRQALENIRAVLLAADADLSDVVKSTVHLADLDDFAAFNAAYEAYFSPPRPVRTTVGSTLAGILVEIDVVAHAARTDHEVGGGR
jgi:2-iminobutanoate/2-iminopropanoate deaminase